MKIRKSEVVIIYSRFEHPVAETVPEGHSLTDQQYKDECDIDVILKRYRGGQPLPNNGRVGRFGDFSEIGDFNRCMERVRGALDDFASLPAVVRARFGNEPKAFYSFMFDPSNAQEIERLGLGTIRNKPVEVTATPAASPAPSGDGNAITT